MAKERGAFEVYNTEREQNNPFIQRLAEADPSLYDEMKQYGRRNIACLTIAPTGTTSLMTQTTSGIEPVFLPVYKRLRSPNRTPTKRPLPKRPTQAALPTPITARLPKTAATTAAA